MNRPNFTALILAGDRKQGDPVAGSAGVSGKSIVPVAGTPMIIRVIEAVETSSMADNILICGPAESVIDDCPALREMIKQNRVAWLPPGNSPCSSAAYCLDHIDETSPVFLTTADHALLTAEIIRYFLEQSTVRNSDATVGLVDYEDIIKHYPDSRRTRLKFRNGSFCGCNLFTLSNSRGRSLISLWKQVEQNRKHPLKILNRLLGTTNSIYYFLGKLTLNDALLSLARKYDVNADAVILPYPAAGVDVDTIADLHLAESIISAANTTDIPTPL